MRRLQRRSQRRPRTAPSCSPLRGHGTLELVAPAGFTHAITQPPGDVPPRLSFEPAGATTKGRITIVLD